MKRKTNVLRFSFVIHFFFIPSLTTIHLTFLIMNSAKVFFVAALSLLLFNSLAAQELKLNVSNHQPRVGEVVSITINIDFLHDQIDAQLNDELQLDDATFMEKRLSRSFTASKPGTYNIGPISFTFNGKSFTSNQLTIEVIEALPSAEGFWLRHVTAGNNEEFIIIEQHLPQKPSKEKTRTEKIRDFDTNAYQPNISSLVKPIEKPAKGLEIKLNSSWSKSAEGTNNLVFTRQIYTVKKNNEFEGSFTFDNTHFENLPPKVKLPLLTIEQ